jgi:hypothetical protein
MTHITSIILSTVTNLVFAVQINGEVRNEPLARSLNQFFATIAHQIDRQKHAETKIDLEYL